MVTMSIQRPPRRLGPHLSRWPVSPSTPEAFLEGLSEDRGIAVLGVVRSEEEGDDPGARFPHESVE